MQILFPQCLTRVYIIVFTIVLGSKMRENCQRKHIYTKTQPCKQKKACAFDSCLYFPKAENIDFKINLFYKAIHGFMENESQLYIFVTRNVFKNIEVILVEYNEIDKISTNLFSISITLIYNLCLLSQSNKTLSDKHTT